MFLWVFCACRFLVSFIISSHFKSLLHLALRIHLIGFSCRFFTPHKSTFQRHLVWQAPLSSSHAPFLPSSIYPKLTILRIATICIILTRTLHSTITVRANLTLRLLRALEYPSLGVECIIGDQKQNKTFPLVALLSIPVNFHLVCARYVLLTPRPDDIERVTNGSGRLYVP